MARFAVTWGDPPGMGDHPDRWLCVACHHELPTSAIIQCGECAHAWRWRWLLSAHRLWRDFQFGPSLPGPWGGPARWWRLDRWIALVVRGVARPSKIWVCPCCSHDL